MFRERLDVDVRDGADVSRKPFNRLMSTRTGSVPRRSTSQTSRGAEKACSGFSRSELETLHWQWEFGARPEQLPPRTEWDFWLIKTGRGWGKTRTGAELVRRWAESSPLLSLVGETAADVRGRDGRGRVGHPRTSPPWFRPTYYPSKTCLVWPNGSIANLFSGDDPDQLRGPQSHKAWVDELAKMRYHEEMWSNLLAGNRLGSHPQVVLTTTPRPLKLIRELIRDPLDAHYVWQLV